MLGDATKRNLSVGASGVLATPVAIGVVYLAEEYRPNTMRAIKKSFAEHVVEPHLKFFDKLSTGLQKAHHSYDEKKRERLIRQGLPVPENTGSPQDPKEHAYAIADAMVKSGLGLFTDITAAYGIQHGINKAFHIPGSHPGANSFADAVVTLGVIAAMPTLFAKQSENLHHQVFRKGLYQKLGLDPKKADELAVVSTYVTTPSLLGMSAALATNHYLGR